MTSMVAIPPLPLHHHHHPHHHQVYQSMQAPGLFVSPTTPLSAHVDHSGHVSPVQAQTPAIRAMDHSAPHPQSPATLYAQSEEERYRHWLSGDGAARTDLAYRPPPPPHGYGA
jgi:hypothetical protein